MTKNEQIRICQIACENKKEETRKYIVYYCFSIILTFLMFTSLFINEKSNLFVGIVVLFFIIILFHLVAIYINYMGYKAFVDLINMHKYEIVTQKLENEDWYFVHIPNTDIYIAAEKV